MCGTDFFTWLRVQAAEDSSTHSVRVAQVSLASAVLLGFAMAEVGVSIQHDANHGAYMPRTWWSWLMAATLDAVGGQSNPLPSQWHERLCTQTSTR